MQEFIITSKDDTIVEIMSCNEILDRVQNQGNQEQTEWCFKRIASHEDPLPRNHHGFNGSLCNVMMYY